MHANIELSMKAESIRIRGTVQGVGFRPFVWQLARQLRLRGQVWNDASGVVIQVWGPASSLLRFRQQLQSEAPPLAHIESLTVTALREDSIPDEFSIVTSQSGLPLTNVSADAATCPQCLAEINDPANRRYRYAFTNCTHCGPRFSIIKRIPYDRANTSMASFPLCPACQAEYDNPHDRRFHAQPNACKDCGPSLWLEDATGRRITDAGFVDDITYAAHLLRQGHILAIKGIGGFHLACDASNVHAVETLRQRKHRYAKPFALMAGEVAIIQNYAHVSDEEVALLQSRAAPIVLLTKRIDAGLPDALAPGQNSLGFMLPYTPLHHLLLQELDIPLVMTSGNHSEEAQCIRNEEALQQLSDIADDFLMHDREIINRLDDSVARVINKQVQVLRRARGYAPRPLELPAGFALAPAVLAMGAELKNTFCLLKEGKAILSQHQGDLEDASVFHSYRDNIKLYQELFDHEPTCIVIDKHPDYISSQYGLQLAAQGNIDVVQVQHHHAHIAACMAEHGLPLNSPPVLGIVMDGLGYGEHAELWGGEFLLADYSAFQRLACLPAVAMPGAGRAMREPWRNAFAHLDSSLGWQQVVTQYPELPFVKFMQTKNVANLKTMICKGLNSPAASSTGRLFDALAAVLGICVEEVSYEGEAAMQLEALAAETFATCKPYPYQIVSADVEGVSTVQWQTFWQAVLEDLANGISAQVVAGRFHQTLACIVVNITERLAQEYDFSSVVLAGGVMQNRILSEALVSRLAARYAVLSAGDIPANDAGIALGQVVIAAAQLYR